MLFGKPKGLPVLALRDVVVFPFETKALVVARPQSVANLLKADSEDKSMLLVMQQDAVQINPTLTELHNIGTLAKILQVLRLPDNKYRVVRGEARVSIDKVEQQDLLWLGVTPVLKLMKAQPKRTMCWCSCCKNDLSNSR